MRVLNNPTHGEALLALLGAVLLGIVVGRLLCHYAGWWRL